MSNSRYEESSSRASMNKYYCPKCNEMLKAITTGNFVNARSSAVNGTNMLGNMKTYKTEFQCPICRLRYTIEELRKIEQKNKKL